jgi:hypothetical protein
MQKLASMMSNRKDTAASFPAQLASYTFFIPSPMPSFFIIPSLFIFFFKIT